MSTEKKTILMVKSTTHGYIGIITEDMVEHLGDDRFVISKPVVVEFEMIDEGDQVNRQIACL